MTRLAAPARPARQDPARRSRPRRAERPGSSLARGGSPSPTNALTGRRPERPGTYLALLAVILSLNLLGLVMVLSASSVIAIEEHGSAWHFALRQGIWLLIGCAALLVVMRVDYHRWRRFAGPMLGGTVVLLVAVLVPGVGMTINGASRWLDLGPASLQPSEIAKVAILLWCADLLARRSGRLTDLRLTLLPAMVALGGVTALLMLQPNLGTAIILAAIVFALLFVAGAPLVPLGLLAAAGALAATAAALGAGYRRARLLGFLDPWQDPLHTGYQSIQSLVGLASGGLGGAGLGASRAKWGFLPHPHTDFIFAVIGEELGLVGTLGVVAMVVALGVLGARAALLAPDRFGLLLAAGVSAWFSVQAFINIGVVVGILPITGVPLPFVSYGGSSLVFSMVGAGLLLSVARQARAPSQPSQPSRPSRARQPSRPRQPSQPSRPRQPSQPSRPRPLAPQP